MTALFLPFFIHKKLVYRMLSPEMRNHRKSSVFFQTIYVLLIFTSLTYGFKQPIAPSPARRYRTVLFRNRLFERLNPSPLFLVGVMGCGKTSIGTLIQSTR
jgi:hypothetical protein